MIAPFVAGAVAWLGLLAVLAAPAAHADVDLSEYESKTALKDNKSRQDYLRQIAAEKAEAARREAVLAEQAQRQAEAQRLVEAARPWPERLTEQRCTLCHAATNYTTNGHTLAGWWVVAVRMKAFNRAPLSWDELRVVVPYLTANFPAREWDGPLEWSLVLAALAAPVLAAVLGRWLWRRRRS